MGPGGQGQAGVSGSAGQRVGQSVAALAGKVPVSVVRAWSERHLAAACTVTVSWCQGSSQDSAATHVADTPVDLLQNVALNRYMDLDRHAIYKCMQ